MNTRALLLAITSGVIFGAAWRGSIPSFFGVLGLGLFFVCQERLLARHWFRRAALAWLTGFTAFAIACSWIFDTAEYLLETDSALVLVPVGFAVWSIHAAPFVCFALLFRHLRRLTNTVLIVPPLWLLCECLSPSLFPFPVGCLLLDIPWLAQPAEVGGIALLSLLAACYAPAVPGAIAIWMRWRDRKQGQQAARKAAAQQRASQRRRKSYRRPQTSTQVPTAFVVWVRRCLQRNWREASVVAVLAMTVVWGAYRLSHFEAMEREGKSLDVLIVQADTAHERANSRMLGAAAKVAGKADLVLWPECSIGNYEQTLASFADGSQVARAAKDSAESANPVGDPATPILLGGDSWIRSGKSGVTSEYVSAYLVDRGGAILGRHDKVSLMPYGESIPGESVFPFLRRWFGSDRVITAGTTVRPIGTVGGLSLGTVLCCEDMVPQLSRQMVREGADVLISLANGIAFKSEVALQQHFRISRCRAIENRRYFVRCASRGVSAVVTPAGTVAEELPILEDCAQIVRVRASSEATIYNHWGLLPVTLAVSLMASLSLRIPAMAASNRRRVANRNGLVAEAL